MQERYRRAYEQAAEDEAQRYSHPAFMSDDDFAALPWWEQVEYNSLYNTRRRPTVVSSIRTSSPDRLKSSDTIHPITRPPSRLRSNPEFIASLENPSQIDLNSGDTTLVEALPLSPIPHPVEVFDESSQLAVQSGETTLLESPSASSVSASSPNIRQTLQRLGILSPTSFPVLQDARRYVRITEAQGPESHSGSIVNDTISHESESESDDCHIGDGMPPRDPERSTIANTRDGQRRVWIITPGRPRMEPLEMEQAVFMRGGAGSDDDDDDDDDGSGLSQAEEMRLLSGRGRRSSNPFPLSRLTRHVPRIRQRARSSNDQNTTISDIRQADVNEVISTLPGDLHRDLSHTLTTSSGSSARNDMTSAGTEPRICSTSNDMEPKHERLVRVYPRPSPRRPIRPSSVGSRFTERIELDGAQLYILPYSGNSMNTSWLIFARYEDSLRRPGRFNVEAFSWRSSQRSSRNRARSLPPTTTEPLSDQHESSHWRSEPLWQLSGTPDNAEVDPEDSVSQRRVHSEQLPARLPSPPVLVRSLQPESQPLLQSDSLPSSGTRTLDSYTYPMGPPRLRIGPDGRYDYARIPYNHPDENCSDLVKWCCCEVMFNF